MKTNHPLTRIAVDALVRESRAKIDEFIARIVTDGPAAAIESLSAAAIEAETIVKLLALDRNAEGVRERASNLLIADDYVFGHATTRDAERAAARRVVEVCLEAESRE